MKIIATLLAVCMSFVAGWLGNALRTHQQVERLEEARDAAMAMADVALSTSQKALSHSVASAETLEICLTKLGLSSPKSIPRRTVSAEGLGLARLDP